MTIVLQEAPLLLIFFALFAFAVQVFCFLIIKPQ